MMDNSTNKSNTMRYGLSLLTAGVIGVYFVYRLNRVRYKRHFIQFYQENRPWTKTGLDFKRSSHSLYSELPSIRIMSYNMLADGPKYALQSDYGQYTPLKYRKWNYRHRHLLLEMESYGADILALQETTYRTYQNSLSLSLELMGYDSVHVVRDLNGHRHGFEGHTDCVCFKRDKFIQVHQRVIRFNEECDDKLYDAYFGVDSDFRTRTLKRYPDILIVLHLALKERPSYQLVVASTHLHYHPKNPHVKVAQTLMLNEALANVMQNEWDLSLEETPIICCGDFNTMPIKTDIDEFDPLPRDVPFVPAAYQLMTEGFVPRTHIEHPYQRIQRKIHRSIYYDQHPEIVVQLDDTETDDDKRLQIKQTIDTDIERMLNEQKSEMFDMERYPQLQQLRCIENLTDYRIGIRWKSVMDTVGQEPAYTTRTPRFTQTIDYIFCNDRWRILGYSPIPSDTKGYMPNTHYVSDHFALCADLMFMPDTQKQTRQIVSKLDASETD